MIVPSIILTVLIVLAASVPDSWARREVLDADQKTALVKIDRVLVDVVAITDSGAAKPDPLADVVARRLNSLGYTIVTDPAQPHDAVFKVKCEQRKVWEGTSASGGDADLPDSPSRVWKGPACQLSYLLNGKKMGWRKEVRTEFPDAVEAAAAAKAEDAGTYAMDKLRARLEEYEFPILITAEWGQDERLLKLLDDPGTSPARRVKAIAQLGNIFSAKAVPRLLTALKDPDMEVAKAAVIALGNIGKKDSVPVLVETMKSGPPELRPSAAKALGLVGALHGDFSIIPPLLEALKTDDILLKTEVAWALGKLPDRRAYEPLFAIYKSLQKIHGTEDPKIVKLKEAVNYSLKQIDTWEYIQ
jgi:hypothetical protein